MELLLFFEWWIYVWNLWIVIPLHTHSHSTLLLPCCYFCRWNQMSDNLNKPSISQRSVHMCSHFYVTVKQVCAQYSRVFDRMCLDPKEEGSCLGAALTQADAAYVCSSSQLSTPEEGNVLVAGHLSIRGVRYLYTCWLQGRSSSSPGGSCSSTPSMEASPSPRITSGPSASTIRYQSIRHSL